MKAIASKVFRRFASGARKRSKRRRLEELKSLIQTERNKVEGIFDADWYLASYPDVAAKNGDPLEHYLTHGAYENRKPGPNFDAPFYLDFYADVAASGENPVVHYIKNGRAEQRAPNPQFLKHPTREPNYVIAKEFAMDGQCEAAVFVTHAPAGRLKPHVLPYVQLLRTRGLAVLLVVVVNRPVDFLDEEIEAASGIVVRENAGYDFGAWVHGLQLYPEIWKAQILYITNDSVIPTTDLTSVDLMFDRIRKSEADIVALTASHEYGWHIQSYFLAVKASALSSWAFQFFVRDVKLLDDKDAVIRAYEVPFGPRMQAAGLSVDVLFSSPYPVNPTLYGWRELIDEGFPFVKLLLLRGQFPDADTSKWIPFLRQAGFDIPNIKATIRASELTAPAGETGGLLARPEQFQKKVLTRPLRIAYIGPWNYDNGLGQASRELLGALRRTNCDLNIYPVSEPFHIHRQLSPAVPTTDFSGHADVAIVHLNPDSWHLLTTEQRGVISSAERRIGYWVWETDTIPEAWYTDLRSVERVWAPTQYCADVFEEEIRVPVDVVPHPVALPDLRSTNRNDTLGKFDIESGKRVILFVFDGASYLVRKNPAALIRAFAKSGLEAKGWCLLLKTKHLFDRIEAGKELTDLARGTLGVRLINASLPAEDLTALLESADIYASPHCSEGFGLTIAEAMALGKPVVATDFSGSRDFLDASCGYPVKAHDWMLEEDHGHYLSGHSWGRIDEDALATALVQAACRVDAGDLSIGDAARANIAAKLSYETVACAIEKSLNAVMEDEAKRASAIPLAPPPPILPKVNFRKAKSFSSSTKEDGIVPIFLEPDLSWKSTLPADFEKDEWYFFAPVDAKIAPAAFNFVRASIMMRPDVVLFYADDVAEKVDPLDRVRLKPDFDATLIAAQDYIGAPVIVRASIVHELGGLNAEKGTAALYDFVMRVSERGCISRIPHVLLGHDYARKAVSAEQRRDVLKSIRRYADYDVAIGADGDTRLVRRFTSEKCPSVTILIPTRRSRLPGKTMTYVERLLAQIAKTDWPMDRLTVLIGDDIEESEQWTSQDWPFALRRITTPRPAGERFNYAAKMNVLWRAAQDEQIVLMNDDVLPHDPSWLKALQTFALDHTIGGVGAKLFYDTGVIQHAGIFPSLRIAVHAWVGMESNAKTYQNWANRQREWSMVTGAVFATRKSMMRKVNGFDERFSLEFNDIDLCLRMRALGYNIAYTPDARFTHTEKASRGTNPPPAEDAALFLARWSQWLEKDPSSHPHYAHNRMDVVPAIEENAWYRS